MPPSPIAPTEPVPAMAAGAALERRGPDRRRRRTPMLSRYSLFGGRRTGARRAGEQEGIFVDRHGPGLLAVVLLIVVLNVLDAWFTLLFLSHGGREMNPVVQAILDWGNTAFLAFKTVGIGACVGILALTKNFRAARVGLWVVASGYTLLLGWHLWLIQYIV